LDVLKKQKEKYKTKSKKMKEILKKLKTSSTESQENRSFQDLNLKDETSNKVDDSVSLITNLLCNMK